MLKGAGGFGAGFGLGPGWLREVLVPASSGAGSGGGSALVRG